MENNYRQLQREILERNLISSDYDVARTCLEIKGSSDITALASSYQIPEPIVYEFITCLGALLGQDEDFRRITTRQLVKRK